jgi:hypothetical protein
VIQGRRPSSVRIRVAQRARLHGAEVNINPSVKLRILGETRDRFFDLNVHHAEPTERVDGDDGAGPIGLFVQLMEIERVPLAAVMVELVIWSRRSGPLERLMT